MKQKDTSLREDTQENSQEVSQENSIEEFMNFLCLGFGVILMFFVMTGTGFVITDGDYAPTTENEYLLGMVFSLTAAIMMVALQLGDKLSQVPMRRALAGAVLITGVLMIIRTIKTQEWGNLAVWTALFLGGYLVGHLIFKKK